MTELTQEEWTRRYKQRIVDVLLTENDLGEIHWTQDEANDVAEGEFEAMGYEELVAFYGDDPEGSADESLSYWENEDDEFND